MTTIEITGPKIDAKKVFLTITSTQEPTSNDLTIINKYTADVNIDIKLGLGIPFLENGQVRFMVDDSNFVIPDQEVKGLQEINSGTIRLKTEHEIGLKLWNTVSSNYEIVVLIFINSKSDATFVDPVALSELTSQSETLLDEATALANSPITQNFQMNGYKALILNLGTKTGLNDPSVHSNTGSWINTDDVNKRSRDAGVLKTFNGTGNFEIIYDYGSQITGDLCILYERGAGSGTSHIVKIETSTDDVSYTEYLDTGNITDSTPHLRLVEASHTFRYVKIIYEQVSANTSMRVGLGLKNYLGTTVTAKFQTSSDNGSTYSDFILSTEYDTVIDNDDEEGEAFTISRDNPSTTNAVYIFPQGANRLRIHLTLALYSTLTNHDTMAGYGGSVSIEKLN